jgi:hypothetical protein
MGEPVDREQSGRGDDQLGQPGGERGEAGELPPQCEIERWQRRMRVRERAEGNQRAGAEKIVSGGYVVASLVPVVGQAQQGEVREIECDKDQRKDQPQRKGLAYLLIGVLPRGRSEEGEDCRLRGLLKHSTDTVLWKVRFCAAVLERTAAFAVVSHLALSALVL